MGALTRTSYKLSLLSTPTWHMLDSVVPCMVSYPLSPLPPTWHSVVPCIVSYLLSPLPPTWHSVVPCMVSYPLWLPATSNMPYGCHRVWLLVPYPLLNLTSHVNDSKPGHVICPQSCRRVSVIGWYGGLHIWGWWSKAIIHTWVWACSNMLGIMSPPTAYSFKVNWLI